MVVKRRKKIYSIVAVAIMWLVIYGSLTCFHGSLRYGPPLACHAAQANTQHGAVINVLVGVLSRSTSHESRAAIRATWGGHSGLYRVVFFLARAREEHVFNEVSKTAKHCHIQLTS